jgi:hypothetical protein
MSVTTNPVAATGPGALDGFANLCDTCGDVARYSLETIAVYEAEQHERWHRSRKSVTLGGGRSDPMTVRAAQQAEATEWDTVQRDLRAGVYGDWQTIRHGLCTREARRNPDQGISTSDVNHMAFGWVKSGADHSDFAS